MGKHFLQKIYIEILIETYLSIIHILNYLLLLVQMYVVLVRMNRHELPIHPDPRQRAFLRFELVRFRSAFFYFLRTGPCGVIIICAIDRSNGYSRQRVP